MKLLLVLEVPDDGFAPEVLADIDAEDVAQGFIDIINEERRSNGESRPGWYKPVGIHAIPGPQWLTSEGMAQLLLACRLVAQIKDEFS